TARRHADTAGASDRLSDLSAGVAEHGLARAATAQLHDRRARRALYVRLPRDGAARALSHVARARHEARDTSGAALEKSGEPLAVGLQDHALLANDAGDELGGGHIKCGISHLHAFRRPAQLAIAEHFGRRALLDR